MNCADAYFKQIKKRIPVNGAKKKEYLCGIREEIDEYCAWHPEATLADYCARFGTPDEIAVSFLSEMTYREINDKLNNGRKALRVACMTAAVISIVAAIAISLVIGHMIDENNDFRNGYIVEQIH